MPPLPIPDPSFLRYGQVGTEFILIVLGAGYAGYLLDERRGGSTLFFLIGVPLGFVLGLARLVRVAQQMNEPGDRKGPDPGS